MSKFTPGPWTAEMMDQEFYTIDDPNGVQIGEAYGKADARLIAAAPELFVALKRFLAATKVIDPIKIGKAAELARAALSKAGGGDE